MADSKRIRKIPAYLKDFVLSTCDDIMSNLQNVAEIEGNLKLVQRSHWPNFCSHNINSKIGYGSSCCARPKHSNPSPNIMVELDKTIEELTIQNKELERELLEKKNALLLKQMNSCDSEKSKVKADTLKGKTKTKDSKHKTVPTKLPTLSELRASDKVRKQAKMLTQKILDDSSSSSSDSESKVDSSDTESEPNKADMKGKNVPYALFKDKQKRKAVSGEARAAKDRVKFDVPWPHEYAQVKSLNYSDKDFGLTQLVRGEVFIMHNIEKSVTSTLRQKHLINLLYLAEKFPFSEIKDFHAEVLRSIERGHKTWSQTFSEEQGRTLVSPLASTSKQSKEKSSRGPICGAYQAGNCNRTGDHFGTYGDKKLLHICRKCVRKGKDPSDPSVKHPSKECTES